MPTVTASQPPKGLEGVVATTSSICYIDGDRGVLAYRGIDIHELAEHSTFEETCYLLWHKKLPNSEELRQLRRELAEQRHIDEAVIDLMRNAPKNALPMDILRTAVSALGPYDPEERSNEHDANIRKSIR